MDRLERLKTVKTELGQELLKEMLIALGQIISKVIGEVTQIALII
jgi:hypothetical protein